MDGHRKIIKKNRKKLVEKVDVMSTSILDELVEKDVLSQEQLVSIKQTCSNNIQRVSAILDHLYTRPPEDWSTFLKCLSDGGFSFLVKELSSPEADFGDLQRLVARKIRDKYSIVEFWSIHGQCESVPIEEICVDVVLQCTIQTSCNVLAGYRELFNKFSEAATIHIYGESGTGKSILSTRLCFDWASQHARGGRTQPDLSGNFGDVKFVLPVYLKDVKQEHTFLDFVADSYGLEVEDAEDLCKCIEKYQESILLVFDGLDDSGGISEDITKILQRNMYPRIKILITSRNTMVEDKAIGKCAPDLEITLHGFSDDGIQEYVKQTCQKFRDMEDLLLDIKNSNFLDRLSHYPALLWLIIKLWQAAVNADQEIDKKSFFLEFLAYVIGRNENKQKSVYPNRKSKDLLIRENHELIMSLGKVASTSVKEDRMDQEFSSEVVSEHIDPGDLKMCLKSGLLLKKREENSYMFVHKVIQDMFLSYFLGKRSYTELLDMALIFCECQKAFIVCDISCLTLFIKDDSTKALIEILCSGNEADLATRHTDLQLLSLKNNEEVDLVLPKVTYLNIDSGNCEHVTKYFSKDGSRLEKLTVASHETFLCLLGHLTAPNLTSLTISKSTSWVEICNIEHVDIYRIVPVLRRFPLKILEIQDIDKLSDHAICAIVQAACQTETLEYLSFSYGTLTAEHIHSLCSGLPRSNLRALIIRQCDLKIEPLLEIIDVLPTFPRLQNLDVSKNYIKFGVDRLIDKTEKFLYLRKLNMSLNQIPPEIKQQIKEKLQCYPELELEIEKQSDLDV